MRGGAGRSEAWKDTGEPDGLNTDLETSDSTRARRRHERECEGEDTGGNEAPGHKESAEPDVINSAT